ncbi:MAG TPA: 3-isopropylmalate dehydrogenase [Candidatus Dormibacteraeota bacterium]|jgi:3-isopropylmalate dehydrogenase
MAARSVVVLPGDGIGPEVTDHALAVLESACAGAGVELVTERRLIGGCAIETEGRPLADETVAACQAADAVLLGAVGGPEWDHLTGDMRCESGLLRLRKELGVFANLRPVKVHPALAQRSTLKPEVIEGVDLVVVRELTGGIYFGQPRGREGSGPEETARDTMIYSRAEIERVTRVAFELARGRRGRLTSVDKQNVLVTSRLWRDVVNDVAADYADVELEHQLVDACAMRLVRAPRDFDVVVTENLFGDILTDEAGMLTGSLGMLPSASLGEPGGPGLYEPIHGSAPDIAGKGLANPLGSILCVAMMLRLSLDLPDAAAAVETAVDEVIDAGTLTPDLGGSANTNEVAAAVLAALANRLQPAAANA